MPKRSGIEKLFSKVKKAGVIRARDASEIGVHPQELARLAREGRLVRVGRGLYALPEWLEVGYTPLAEICKQVPSAVICLLSALYYHEVGTQLPAKIWIGIPRDSAIPRGAEVPIRTVTYSEASHKAGVERHEVEGAEIRVYSIAKTVADCWKHRNRIGLDVALEALKDVLHRGLATPDEILKYAEINRVAKVIKPYMEALV